MLLFFLFSETKDTWMLSYLKLEASLNGQRWSFLRVCPEWNQHLEKILASQVFTLTRNSCVRVPRMCQVMFNCSQSCKRKASIEVYHPRRTFCLISYKRSAFFTSQCAETTYKASARLRRGGAQWRNPQTPETFYAFLLFMQIVKTHNDARLPGGSVQNFSCLH